jgi:endonuclease/exonuclease/phosphatase family metal-dependent hydrolase
MTAADTQPFLESDHQRLRMLSFNIQVGIDTAKYSDYIRKSWRHVLPHSGRHLNLKKVAELIKEYDIVALQEVDAGSLRSNYVNQVEYIAQQAGFPHWHVQRNRNLATIAAHANGLLSKIPAEMVIDHSLPGLIPGRGALEVSFGAGAQSLVVMVAHLALGKKAQRKQINYIAECLACHDFFVLMGDFNCEPDYLAETLDKAGIRTRVADNCEPTYPSWNPKKSLDHIVVSEHLIVENVRVIPQVLSDHLPIAMEVTLPIKLAQTIKARSPVSASHTCSL